MELRELADDIFCGVEQLSKLDFVTSFKPGDHYVLYIKTLDVFDAKSTVNPKFIRENVFKKLYRGYQDKIIQYGDFLIDLETFRIHRFDANQLSRAEKYVASYTVLPSANILIIRGGVSYLTSFFEKKEWQAFFKEKLRKIADIGKSLDLVGKIVIPENLENFEHFKQEGARADTREVDISQINIKQGVMTLDKILKRIKYGEINIETNTYFQRSAGLWEDDVKSRLVEALIVKQPIPAFYFEARNPAKWLIIDGLQRLSTIHAFVNNQLELESLYYLPKSDFEGKTFSGLPRWAQRNIEEYEIIAYQVENPTPMEVTYKIFRSINTSSLTLEKQEIRHALNFGKPTEYLQKLANLSIFRKVMPLSPKEISRMKDREFVLRYAAFRMTHYSNYKPDMTDFLDDAMTKINTIVDKDLETYANDFGEALFALDKIFGHDLFRKNSVGLDNENFTQILYEIWSHAVAQLEQSDREKLVDKKQEVLRQSQALSENKVFAESIENSKAYNIGALETRFRTIEELVKNIVK
ncbi:MAG: DUF262 domain-containing protein [Bernardetiaceae bacterium]|nr:DUF262 domain-containing protein [Bernardetiaceae bacterium]